MNRVIAARAAAPERLRPTLLRHRWATLLLAGASGVALANSFSVDTGTDGPQNPANTATCAEVVAPGNNTLTGHCSLRAAIMVGNHLSGSHTITFTAAASTVTIVNGALAQIRAPFTINGLQGIARTTINGGGHGCIDLTDSGDAAVSQQNGANNSVVKYLAIWGCSGAGISANGHGYDFNNNYIGLSALGAPVLAANTNTGHGISLSASAAYQSQFIDVAGLKTLYDALPAQPVDSSQINSFSVNIATALQNLNPNKITSNTISGNQLNGIEIFSENLAATIISTNFIGTDPTGNTAIANGGSGVHLTGDTFANLIGPANVISGNTQNGIQVDAGAVYLPNFIMGNRIGLASAVGNHVGNGGSGIVIDTKPDTTAGHFNPSGTALIVGPANVISDNQGANNNNFPDQLGTNAGVLITGASTGIKVIGNTIGLAEFPAGTPSNSTQYGNKGDGIIVTTSGNKIGGSAATDGNIVSGNARHGIVVSGGSTTSNSILGNSIGVSPAFAGNLTLGNGVDGVHVDAASSTTIGGAGATDFNTIAANGRNGIKILDGGTGNGWSNLSQRNRIFHNAMLTAGIGLDLDHPENAIDPPHTEYPPNYANLDQVQPVICAGPADSGACNGSAAPLSGAGSTTLQWTIATHGPADFRMEFFQIDAADDNSATSMTFLGEQLVSTDITGALTGASCTSTRCTVTLPVSTGGSYVLMTANDITPLTDQPGGGSDWKSNLICFAGDLGNGMFGPLNTCNVNNSSEFSNVATIPSSPPGSITLAATNITATSATLNGTASANGAATSLTFNYGPTASYGSSMAGTAASPNAGPTNVSTLAKFSGVPCHTTSHFHPAANNSNGTTHGGDLSFTTAPCSATPPTVATLAASAITATSAQLNGTVSANGASTTVTFDYGATVSYSNNTVAAQSPLSSGASNAAVSLSLTGLTCNSTYHFRVKAANSAGGPINGSDLSFTTAVCAAVAPTVASNAATAVTATSATLNGTVSAHGPTTNVTFDFGTTTGYGALGSPATATQSPLTSGASNAAVSVTLSGLMCNTLYHFRANANNGVGGTINGNDLTFTTGACGAAAPTVTTLAATAITTTTATFNGTVSANGASTTVTFDYGPTVAYGTNAPAAQSPLAASANNASVTFGVIGLTCGTTYHFRANANNGVGGTINGGDLSFATAACAATPPTATTNAASSITTTSALLNGTVTANGATTTVVFNYGPTNAYGSTISATQSPLSSGSTNAPVSAALSGLTCNTLYHFQVTANNGVGGTISGSDLTFITGACPGVAPTATTAAATSLSTTGATVNGTVTANGASTTVNFDYGLTTGYGSNVAAAQSPLGAAASNAAVSAALSGLTCNTTYHFRVNANNGTGGTIHGGDLTFTTSVCPVLAPSATTSIASAITATSATLNGTVSAHGASTTVMFEYGPTAAYGSSLAATQSPLGAAASNAAVSINATGLTCGTLYHFRVDANNGVGGTITGADQTFNTSACAPIAPTATTNAATAITANSALLNGTVSANGAATSVTFDYGTTAAYGSSLAATQSPLGSGASNAAVSVNASGLTCGTLYHFRVNANNGVGGTIHGADLTFTTSACPAIKSFSGPTFTGTGTATAVLSGGGASCSLVAPAFVGPPAAVPPGLSFPDGLFSFSATGCSGTITLTVTFPTAFVPAEQYWKYGPTPGNAAPHWYTLTVANNNVSLAGNVATFTIADGSFGDDDLAVNGTIVDQGGPGVSAAPVQPVPAPAMNLWGLLGLATLLALFAATHARASRMRVPHRMP